jgi:hypothetical protein
MSLDKIDRSINQVIRASSRIADVTPRMGPFGARGVGSRVAISASWALLLFFAARFGLEVPGLATWLRVAIALVPVPALGWFLWEFVQSVSRADELERRIQLEALALAFPLTLLLVMTLGLLQIAIPLPPEDWSYRHIWPLLYVFYLGGLTLARKRYL